FASNAATLGTSVGAAPSVSAAACSPSGAPSVIAAAALAERWRKSRLVEAMMPVGLGEFARRALSAPRILSIIRLARPASSAARIRRLPIAQSDELEELDGVPRRCQTRSQAVVEPHRGRGPIGPELLEQMERPDVRPQPLV